MYILAEITVVTASILLNVVERNIRKLLLPDFSLKKL